MGLTPLEGLMMGTRSGSVDPAIVGLLADMEEISTGSVLDILNFESGLKGVSGISSDWRDIEEAANRGDQRAAIALQMFAYRVRKQIGAFMAAAPGPVDAVVFGGGIGEHSSSMRQLVLSDLGHIGIDLDIERNETLIEEKTRVVSNPHSPTQILVTHVDEMRQTAEVALKKAHGVT
jgi:acetate kinase